MRMTDYQCKHGIEWAEGCEHCEVAEALAGIEKATREHEVAWNDLIIRKET